jgi:galactonate dehydratase
VEIALWDILGQALGVPIYKLLGGAARKRIRLYKDVGGETTEQWSRSFVRAKAEGYSAAKSGFVSVNNDLVIPSFAVREGAKKLEAVRKAVVTTSTYASTPTGTDHRSWPIDFCTRSRSSPPSLSKKPLS